MERVVLVGAPLADEPEALVEEHLEELERLADTAGAEVAGTLSQRRQGWVHGDSAEAKAFEPGSKEQAQGPGSTCKILTFDQLHLRLLCSSFETLLCRSWVVS